MIELSQGLVNPIIANLLKTHIKAVQEVRSLG